MTVETIYNGKILRKEKYYTEQQWMHHVEKHALKVLKRYVKRKLKRLAYSAIMLLQSVGILGVLISFITLVGVVANIL